jgi:hypothetical protein
MIQVGQKVRFNPFTTMKDSVEQIRTTVTGTVVWINGRHKWFSVQYGNDQRTSFKFSEIGQNVHICK